MNNDVANAINVILEKPEYNGYALLLRPLLTQKLVEFEDKHDRRPEGKKSEA